jgi:hypothetical protein
VAVVSADAFAALREEFVCLLTLYSDTQDRRRKDFNLAIFAPEEQGGYAIWTQTDLSDVMGKFDKAVKNLAKERL